MLEWKLLLAMATMDGQGKQTVAVVGSGMAGLVTAYLLRRDPQQRYEVEIFETVNKMTSPD